jgi:ATP-dependent protease ClpP protease subunit
MQSSTDASDFIYMKMELTANAGAALLDRIEAENRPRTWMENAQLQLMQLDQETRRRKWAEAREAEGKSTRLYKRLTRPSRDGSLRIANAAGTRPAIYLFGEIGAKFGGITAEEFQRELATIPANQDVELHIHSDGGSYVDALAMRSLVASRPGRTDGFVDGLAASAATVILMGCTSVTMARGSSFMIHFCAAEMRGTVEDFEFALDSLRNANEEIMKTYLPRWRGTEAELRAALERETWYTAEQAVAAGLADRVADTLALAAKVSSRHEYKNIPSNLAIAAHGAYTPRRDKIELGLHRVVCV